MIEAVLADICFAPKPEVTSHDSHACGVNTDIGDTRMKLFWLIGTDDEFVRAIVPTGDDQKGTGGGS